MLSTYNITNDFVPFDDWFVNFLAENPGIEISFHRFSLKQNDPLQILIKMRHITGSHIDRIVEFDGYDRVSKKSKLIEEIDQMMYQIKEEVHRFNCGVD